MGKMNCFVSKTLFLIICSVAIITFTPIASVAQLDEVGRINIPGTASGLGYHVDGNYAYVVRRGFPSGPETFRVVNISNKSAPFIEGQISDLPFNNAFDMWYGNGFAFTAHRFGGVNMIDVSNPASPFVTSTAPSTYTFAGIMSVGNFLYVADHSAGSQPGGMRIFDISANNLNQIGTLFGPPLGNGGGIDGRDLAISSDNLYAYQSSGLDDWPKAGLYTYDISNKTNPSVLNFIPDIFGGQLLISPDDMLLFMTYTEPNDFTPPIKGVKIFDLSNPTQPVELTTISLTNGGFLALDYGLEILYVNAYNDPSYPTDTGIHVFDISDPSQPTEVHYLSDNDFVGLFYHDDHLYAEQVVLLDRDLVIFTAFGLEDDTPDPQVLEAEADATIRTDLNSRRNDNYACDPWLLVGTGRGGGGIPLGGPDAIRSLIRFDLSGVSQPVTSAFLELTPAPFSHGTVFTVDIHRIVDSGILTPWIEGDGTVGFWTSTPPGCTHVDPASGVAWVGTGDGGDANNQTQPNFDTPIEASTVINATTSQGSIQLNITSLVNDWINGVIPNNGVMLTDETTDGTFRHVFIGSREGELFNITVNSANSPPLVKGPRLILNFGQNQPPIADAGQDIPVCTSSTSALVTLDGSGSSDPELDALTYTWRENAGIIAGPTSSPTSQVTLGLGSHTIELTVDDGTAADTDEVVVNVNPNPTVTFNPAGPFFISDPAADLSTFVSPAGGSFSGPGITGNNFTPASAGAGTQAITYSFTDANGCSNIAVRNITVNLPQSQLPHPFLFLADKKIKIDGLLLSDGDMHSNDKIDFHKGNPSTHTGNLTAVGKVKIDKNHTIEGDVTAGGKIDLKGNAVVTGTVTENATVAVEPLPALSFSAGGNKVTVKKNQSQSLTPGSYGKVKVDKGGTLELSTGDYFFKDLDLKDNTTLSIDVSNGPVTVNTVKKLHFHKNSEVDINSPLGSASQFVTFNSMKKVEIHQGAKVLGTINAPDDKVHLHKNVSFQGAICAKDIDVDKGSILLHHNSSGTLPKIMAPILAVDIEEDVEEEDLTSIPTEFELSQNYPNPFNPSTTIQFSVPEASEVSLKIYNLNGQLVQTLLSGTIAAGRHSVVWNGKDLRGSSVASGIYLYRITAGGFSQVKKMSLMR